MLMKIVMSPQGQALDRWLVRWIGFSLISWLFAKAAGIKNPVPTLYLETLGRKTGKRRGAVLPYFEIDGKMMVVASNGGARTDPFWVHNLRHSPNVAVYIRRKPWPMVARIAAGEERSRYWGHLTRTIDSYRQYEKMAGREIPLVILEKW
jgi:F420H(2)-dependent quinone reductase